MRKQWTQWQTLFWGAPKITADGDCSHEIKRHLLLGRKAMNNLDSILKKQIHYFTDKGPYGRSYGCPVVMYGCESQSIKKAECWRINAFELWCWRRLLRVPWTARRSNQSILKEVSPGCSLEGLMLKPKLQNWLIWKDPDTGKDWRQEEKGNARGWDGWMASLTQWTWVWVNSRSWWWTGRPGLLQSVGSQRVRHNWATKWADLLSLFPALSCPTCQEILLGYFKDFTLRRVRVFSVLSTVLSSDKLVEFLSSCRKMGYSPSVSFCFISNDSYFGVLLGVSPGHVLAI